METPERIEVINQRLIDHFGLYIDGQPYLRIVYSEDIIEKRWTKHSKEGFELPYKELIEAPKYRQWIHNSFVLEKLTEVPSDQQDEALGKLSYEPLWVFQDKNGNPLPPKWEVIVVLLKTLREQIENAGSGEVKYKEDYSKEAQEERLDKLQEALFGNENSITDALAYGDGVGYGSVRRTQLPFSNNSSGYKDRN